jgi:glycoside/pentoside/hexuronide:cation symporter, GPH family
MQEPLPVASSDAPTARPDRVPLREKFGYGLGSFIDMWGHWLSQSLSFQVFNIFLHLDPRWISSAQMIQRLFDAASDPIFGWLSDNTRTRFGRRRPFILVGGVLAGIGLPCLFWVQPDWGNSSFVLLGHHWEIPYYFWYMLATTAVYIPVMSCFNMPWVSLGSEMTPDYNERTSVMSIKNAVQKLPELAMFFALQFTTLAVFNLPDGKPNILLGAKTLTVILGCIMILAAVGVFALVRERYYGYVVAARQEHIPILETLFKTIACRPFRNVLAMVLAYGTSTAMVGILGYYNTVYYVCKGDVALATRWNTAMGFAGFGMGFLGIPFYNRIAHHWGKRHALALVFIMAIAAFIGDWWFYNPNHPALQLLACGCVAFTGAGFWTIYGSILADVIDYDELQTSKRREGSFSSCQSWISKVGMAVGGGASGFILSYTSFNADHPVQSEQTIFMIRFMLSAIPVAGLLLALYAIIRFPLTPERMSEIRTELEARRGKV